MSKIGIMGGTFNPIHIGHLMLAEYAREKMTLDEVWFIPTGVSYMKAPVKAALAKKEGMPLPEERFEMTELAIAENPWFRCLDLEIKREGATYTYETLEELREKYPENEYFFLCGADCLYTIEIWRVPERIFANCTLVASVRGDADLSDMTEKKRQLEEKYRTQGAQIILLPFRNLELSSTDIRNRVKAGESIRYMVPESVRLFIEKKGFYRNDRS